MTTNNQTIKSVVEAATPELTTSLDPTSIALSTPACTRHSYTNMMQMGLEYGPAYQLLQHIRISNVSQENGSSSARADVADGHASNSGFSVSPQSLDAVFQLAAVLLTGGARTSGDANCNTKMLRLPRSVEAFVSQPRKYGDSRVLTGFAQISSHESTTNDLRASFLLAYQSHCIPHARIIGMASTAMSSSGPYRAQRSAPLMPNAMYTTNWQAIAQATQSSSVHDSRTFFRIIGEHVAYSFSQQVSTTSILCACLGTIQTLLKRRCSFSVQFPGSQLQAQTPDNNGHRKR